MGSAGARNRLVTVAAGAAVVLLVLAGLHQVALDRLRRAEERYLAGRQVTACATTELEPFALEARDMEELPAALEDIVVRARAQVRELAADRSGAGIAVVPAVRSAAGAVDDALDAQVRLYDAMVDDPVGSDDDLRLLGRANAQAERRLASARRWLLVGEPERWDERLRCQASSPSSSSK